MQSKSDLLFQHKCCNSTSKRVAFIFRPLIEDYVLHWKISASLEQWLYIGQAVTPFIRSRTVFLTLGLVEPQGFSESMSGILIEFQFQGFRLKTIEPNS